MTLHKIARKLLFAACLFAPLAGFGEDIDLFKGGAAITGQKPNVLIVLDNGASWNSGNQDWPDGLKQGQSELNAITNIMANLTGDVRVGLMAFVKGGGGEKDGGYVRFGIRDMDATNRQAFQDMMAQYKSNFNDQNDGLQVGTAGVDYGAMMLEVWRYFSGGAMYAGPSPLRDYPGNGSPNVYPGKAGSLSGNALASSSATNYTSPLSANSPCNKNFIIWIGNGYPVTASVDPNTLSVTGWTAAHSTSIYAEPKSTYMDEWARFLHKVGITNAPCDTTVTPNICADGLVTTYTIDVYKRTQDVDLTNLLKSAASVGGGKYFQASSEAAIQDALSRIFNEVQAVNSVFTSASLPVSVNTQGTYLNQIYMGVFRPDSAGQPRWMGNLKQYKFGITTDATGNDTIFLADADNKPAVNSVSGFVDPSARSFWTKSTTPSAGFWAHNPTGTGLQYDSPDGDLVEKGGAAQKLRDLGPTSRTVYTCTGCTTGNTPDTFATSNATLLTALTGTAASITSLTRVSTTATVTTAADLLLSSPTDSVSISGSSVAGYNGPFTATKLSATQFTIPVVETPATPATGASITVSSGVNVSQTVPAGGVTWNNGVVTVNAPAHGFVNGQSVVIAGANVSASMATAYAKCAGWTATTTCEFNGTFNIEYVDANNFRYSPPTANLGTLQTAGATTLNPPDTGITAGSSTLTCQNTGSPSANAAVANTSITKVTAGSGVKQFKVVLSSIPANCAAGAGLTSLQLGGSGNNERIVSLVITGTGTDLDATYTIVPGTGTTSGTVTGIGSTCSTGSTATSAANDRTICLYKTVTSVPSFSYATIIPASPATGTITATGKPTRTVTSITRTAGNASNVATVTVTTASPHGFGGSTSLTIAGADQAEYNGERTTANTVGNQLTINSGSSDFTFTIATGPTTPGTGGSAAKGSAIDPTTLINWVRGVDNKEDENVNASLVDCRASIHGDVLHSRPLVINYGDSVGIYAFYGSNDGTFRAVKAGQDESSTSTDGKESWSFVAPEHYTTLGRLYNNSPYIKYLGDSAPKTPRDYFFDGNIGVFQSASLATTHIFISMRRGGRFIYALDVSTPTAPKFLWKKTYQDTGFSELGYTWSEPKVISIKKSGFTSCNASHSGLSTDAASSYTRALVFGAGYDPTSDDTSNGTVRPVATMGRGVFVLKAEDGSLIKLLQAPANDYKSSVSNNTRRYPIPGDVTVLDTDGDGCVDRLYAGDTGAKIHRFDINDVSSANWKAYTIATLGDTGNNGGPNDRKILYPPEVVLSVLGGSQIAYVMVGTGNREHPSSTGVEDRFYMIRDTIAIGTAEATSTTTTHAVRETQLTEIDVFNSATTTVTSSVANNVSCTKNSAASTTTPCFWGWYLPLESGEKSVNAPLTVAGTTFFGTNKPKAADPRSCSANLGEARGYALNFLTGTSAVGDRDANGTINRSDLYSVFKGGGLPPSPVSGVVQISSSKTVRFVIGSGGTGTTGSTIEGVKTQVNPSGTRTRVFWYFKKDD